jgi:hypothetical protein
LVQTPLGLSPFGSHFHLSQCWGWANLCMARFRTRLDFDMIYYTSIRRWCSFRFNSILIVRFDLPWACRSRSGETLFTSPSPERPRPKKKNKKRRRLGKARPVQSDDGSDATQSTSVSPNSFQSTSSEETCSTSLSEDHGRQKRAPPKPHKYNPRLRGGKACRSIDLTNVIFPAGAPNVCRRSALHFLGLGEARVRRICNGRPDGRTRGHRLPNSHPIFAPRWQTCVAFLNHIWHFFAEGLPNRFSLDKSDVCRSRLTLGTAAKAAQPPGGAEGSDSEESEDDEDAERSISAMSLHIQSAGQAGMEALKGPSLGAAPRRYVGVIRPVMMFCLLGRWCAERELTCPGFTTFLKALHEAKPYLKFRKAAGEHANCEMCVHFKKLIKHRLSCSRRQELLEGFCRSFAKYS